MPQMPAPDLLEGFAFLDSCAVSDALDALGLPPGLRLGGSRAGLSSRQDSGRQRSAAGCALAGARAAMRIGFRATGLAAAASWC